MFSILRHLSNTADINEINIRITGKHYLQLVIVIVACDDIQFNINVVMFCIVGVDNLADVVLLITPDIERE